MHSSRPDKRISCLVALEWGSDIHNLCAEGPRELLAQRGVDIEEEHRRLIEGIGRAEDGVRIIVAEEQQLGSREGDAYLGQCACIVLGKRRGECGNQLLLLAAGK